MKSLEAVEKDIKSVKIQGAKPIALYGLRFLKEFCKKNGFELKFEVASMILDRSRPTAVVLHNCIEIIKKKRKISTINKLIKDLDRTDEKISKIGLKIIPQNAKIMTHCHSSEALSIIKLAWRKGKNISVISTETDPLEQGVKTAKELSKDGIPVTLITDNAVGFFMRDVDMVIVGADAIRKEGVANKIGTSLLALSAKSNKKPFYIAANSLKLDRRTDFKIEERPVKEVYREIVHPGKMKGIKLRNPAFDVTKWKYVKAVITEKGIFKPEKIQRMLG